MEILLMNKKFLLQDIKRSLTGWGFWLGFGGLCALFLYNMVTQSALNHTQDSYYIIVNAVAASGFTVFLPLFPVLAYSSDFCEEYESGYYRMILARMSVRGYAQARIISVAISGGAAVGLPVMLMCIGAGCFGITNVSAVDMLRVEADMEMVFISQAYGFGVVVALKAVLGFLFGAVWALVGLAFAVWFVNKYVSLIAPFVLYETMNIFLPKILKPSMSVRGDDIGHILSIAMELLWLAVSVAADAAGFKRRCHDE